MFVAAVIFTFGRWAGLWIIWGVSFVWWFHVLGFWHWTVRAVQDRAVEGSSPGWGEGPMPVRTLLTDLAWLAVIGSIYRRFMIGWVYRLVFDHLRFGCRANFFRWCSSRLSWARSWPAFACRSDKLSWREKYRLIYWFYDIEGNTGNPPWDRISKIILGVGKCLLLLPFRK